MHYHVVRIDDEGEHVDPALTFDRQDEAEERAAAVARETDGPGWSGKRYVLRVAARLAVVEGSL